MSKVSRIAVLAFSLILCITLCFAWINEVKELKGRYMQFLFDDDHRAVVASNELNVKVYKGTEDDEFIDITRPLEDGSAQLTEFHDFAPGSRQKFKAEIENTSDAPLLFRMVLGDIVCENTNLQEFLVLGTSGFEGFKAPYTPPALVSNTLADGTSSGSFLLIDNAEIPAKTTVSVYFYVLFSGEADESVAQQQFTIGSIHFLAV